MQLPRKPKRLETIRRKRRKYRWTKKDSLRWKLRQEAFERGEREEKEEKELEEKKKRVQEQRAKVEEQKKLEEHNAFVEDNSMRYRQAEKESQTNQSDSLLLPIQTQSRVSMDLAKRGLNLSGIDRVAVEAIVEEVEKDKKKAELNALIYRNLAERLKREKRELSNTLNRKVETVRDFWRNKLCEGSSRSGRMVQAACMRL